MTSLPLDGILVGSRAVVIFGDMLGTFALNEQAEGSLEVREAAGTTYYEKSGATPGFTARMVATKSPPLGVVVLANTANVDVNGLAQRIHDAVRTP